MSCDLKEARSNQSSESSWDSASATIRNQKRRIAPKNLVALQAEDSGTDATDTRDSLEQILKELAAYLGPLGEVIAFGQEGQGGADADSKHQEKQDSNDLIARQASPLFIAA